MLYDWLIITFLVCIALYLLVMFLYYRILLKNEEASKALIIKNLNDTEIIIRKLQLQLQRSLGNIDILTEELNKIRNDATSLRARNSQYRLENDQLRQSIKELKGKIEALL